MIEVKGNYNTAIVYTDELEESAESQLKTFCDQEFLEGSKIRVMPDVHSGKGCTIGTTMTIKDAVIPNAVGVDLGCAILTVKLKDKYIDLQHLDKFINQNIPHGKAVRKRTHRGHGRIDVTKLRCYKYMKKKRILESLGTLGSGNHFLEINVNSNKEYYLQVHTGSRNPGLQVANIYQRMANSDCKQRGINIKYDLAYLTGEHIEDYIHDMKIMQEFAALNRRIIADDIIEGLRLKEVERFDTVHNYIDTNNMILRKGACAAYEGQKLIIPMNMRDGSFICVGKGNPDWNYSAPHGAGRLMSRTQAKNTLKMKDYKASMKGIYSTSVSAHTIDEAPMAYKPIENIISQISDTVEIIEQIKPVYNFKSQEW